MSFALGLVGCGGMGRRHLRGMERLHKVGKRSFDLVAVCDVMPESAAAAADMGGSWGRSRLITPVGRSRGWICDTMRRLNPRDRRVVMRFW